MFLSGYFDCLSSLSLWISQLRHCMNKSSVTTCDDGIGSYFGSLSLYVVLGMVDLIGFCVVLARAPNAEQDTIPNLDSTQTRQDLQQTAQTIMPCWIKTRSVVKYAIDVVYVVWMIQAFWKTNDERAKHARMSQHVHLYSYLQQYH